ncbi:tRNA (mnm(5)s(2)U34)-methyltransferase [Halothermothrix orenii]|uniref:Putative rRNA methylase n=1 Tax=Halothermothrix orenii (strain H 168 / OCM 544 / DSM 9562) TaxID=373903 RepID=B8CXD1_HALOH|nr:class I SAM-dependent methyltransferase [Halothermothrix orenii]ACL69950.1 putative rRNA methylase [Halothermothrix orenii H 168]
MRNCYQIRNDFIQAVEFSHDLFRVHVKKGSTVIDATAGNGHDTCFLASLVGEKGQVYSFDIQKKAIEKTKALLKEQNLEERVYLIHDGHENLDNYIKGQFIDGVIFNLGYLPGGDKKIITTPDTTITALKKCLPLIKPGGIVVIVIYTGHEGGKDEEEKIIKYAEKLNYTEYNVLRYHFINQRKTPPQVLAIKKRL